MVIVLLGILAVYAAPRMFNMDDFNARGLHDETMALLRHAQKTAIAQRRTVCVTVAATGVTMTMFTGNPASTTCAAASLVIAPVLAPPFTPHVGTGLAANFTPFQFTPLGSTDQVANITVTVVSSTAITVDAATGYVHD